MTGRFSTWAAAAALCLTAEGGESAIASALPRRGYRLDWPVLWEAGRRTAQPHGCSGKELQNALSFLNFTFEDIELHVSAGAFVGFLGAVLERPSFGRPGQLRLVVLPGLPGSLQIVLTLLGLGLLDSQAASSAFGGDAPLALDEDGVARLRLGLELEDFTAPNFVRLARQRLELSPGEDLAHLPQKRLEEQTLWQSADELRAFQDLPLCGSNFRIVERPGAVINVLHGYALNYYHFVTEQVPALLALRHELSWLPEDRVTVFYFGQKWQAEYAMLAGFQSQQLLAYNPCEVVRGDLVYTASVPDSKAAESLLQIRAAVLDSGFSGRVQARQPPPSCFRQEAKDVAVKRILVIERACFGGSAGGATCAESAIRGCSIGNYQELLQALAAVFPGSEGFSVCSFRAEEHSVASQAAHFEAADVVIGAIGAGLANLIFMRPGALLVALHPAHPEASFSVYSSRCGQSYFWHMAQQLGLGFRALLCPDMTVFEGGRVDVDDFSKFLLTEVQPWIAESGLGEPPSGSRPTATAEADSTWAQADEEQKENH
ncbi:unnamed protein product [Polarella glacialis]|uniref:Glycosyltransferase 61 catalytic domain-containing protein n=1 Tax=Polarella glacialis TaxID=89957 RepID=A0A813HHQ0_POLGL|nr:unnamed protein product [Polarella glacialis]